MTEKDFFHCDQAARRGKPAITKDYCLRECNSAQKGVKAECPPEVFEEDGKKAGSGDDKK